MKQITWGEANDLIFHVFESSTPFVGMHFYSYVKRKEIGMYDTNDVT
jgi:hypothetical protein